jgi:hypothetical protein
MVRGATRSGTHQQAERATFTRAAPGFRHAPSMIARRKKRISIRET